MASATGIPENAPAPNETEPLLGRPGDASQEEGKGLQYNFFIGTGTVAQAGIWIVSSPNTLPWRSHTDLEHSWPRWCGLPYL